MTFTNFIVRNVTLFGMYLKIISDGEFEPTGDIKIKYTGMMRAINTLLVSSYYIILRVLEISCRYSIVR